MREEDVPQEGNAVLGGYRKAVYAVGADGKLRIVESRGWEIEELVTQQAIDDLARRAEDARARVRAGLTSPLEYHMYRARMDVALLAQATGLWRWRVRRHFRPHVFSRLPDHLLRRYAEALGVGVEALQKVD